MIERVPRAARTTVACWLVGCGVWHSGGIWDLGAAEKLVSERPQWRYENSGAEPPAGWREVGFDDSGWESGRGIVGYGGNSLTTDLGGAGVVQPVTTYFRTAFEVRAPGEFEALELWAKVDDGAVIYLNGREVGRINLPEGEVRGDTLANESYRSSYSFRPFRLEGEVLGCLVEGENVLAAEVHQYREGSRDMWLDVWMEGTRAGELNKKVIGWGGEWRYLDSAVPPGDGWRETGFDDAAWGTGKALLGYGEGDVATVLDFGPDPENKRMTVWLRHTFEVSPPAGTVPGRMQLKMVRDDGVIFYLNGRELLRENMPPGFVEPKTPAAATVGGSSERRPLTAAFAADGLVAGKNTLAVELHQSTPDSSDLGFDMALEVFFEPPGGAPPAPGRAPAVATPGRPAVPPAAPGREPVRVNVADRASVEAAGPADWQVTNQFLLETAFKARAGGDVSDAARRYYASRWAAFFAGRGAGFSPELKMLLVSDAMAPVSQEFFDLLGGFDDHTEVSRLLAGLYAAGPEAFAQSPKLAMAIALVYDQQPPRGWPHHQVSEQVLPRKLPDPLEAFAFWHGSGASGGTVHPLDSLTVEELKFVVATPLPLRELAAAREDSLRLNRMAEQYSGIAYVHDRVRTNTYNWPHEVYTLAEIKRRGGICVDQAFYAAETAKAHGVPAMVVSGAGQQGNHAWIGFLDRDGRWNFDVGRYPESKFVSGETYDPQTWRQPTDHELAFLTERFRNRPSYRVSRVHALFAEEFMRRGDAAAAAEACEAAIASEDRNAGAWDTLIEAKQAAGAPPEELEVVYADGAKAFSRYADLEASFLRRLCASFDQRGETDEAERLRRRIISRNRRERPDLAINEARERLEESMSSDPVDGQVALYKSHINRFKEAGLIAFYEMTEPFLEHLDRAGEQEAARDALDYTRRRLEAEPGSQLEEGLDKWTAKVGEG